MTDQKPLLSEEFFDLEQALKDALGEVQTSYVLYAREGALSAEDWARMESTVHAVGDKLRDLKTVRGESQDDLESEVNEAFLHVLKEVTDHGGAHRLAVEAYGMLATTSEKHRARLYLAEVMRKNLQAGDVDKAQILAEVNKAIQQHTRPPRASGS